MARRLKRIETISKRWSRKATTKNVSSYELESLYSWTVSNHQPMVVALFINDLIDLQNAIKDLDSEDEANASKLQFLANAINEFRNLTGIGTDDFKANVFHEELVRPKLNKLLEDTRAGGQHGIEYGKLIRTSEETATADVIRKAEEVKDDLDDIFAMYADKLTSLKLSIEWTDYYKERMKELEDELYGKPSISEIRGVTFPLRTLYWLSLLGLIGTYFGVALLVSSEASYTFSILGHEMRTPSFQYWHFLAPLVLLSVGFAKIAKDLKVKQNLYEQYRHRHISAASLQLILATESGKSFQADDRKVLVQQAAQALFEMKNTGYLSKAEPTSPLVEVINRSIGRSS